MVLRFITIFLLLGVGESIFDYKFCKNGVPKANFVDSEPVEVIYAQAPLFSTNKAIGQKGKYLNLFHTCIVLAQGAGDSRKYWTLEFDFTGGSVLSSIVPKMHFNPFKKGDVTFTWNNDARYCLSEGVLWGEKHWTERFDVVFTITAAQARETFDVFVASANHTAASPAGSAQYQLWRVAKKWPEREMLVQDITCTDGAVWFLHHIVTQHKAIAPPDFELKGTATILNAESVKLVDMKNGSAVDKMALYFKAMSDLISANKSIERRLLDVMYLVHDEKKYVYDSNMKRYYELSGNKVPFIWFEHANYELVGLPWGKSSETSSTMIV